MRNRITFAAAAAAGLAFAAPASATVVALWKMDNTFGTTMVDSSGYGNNGTTYNIVTSGNGYVFNGTTSKAVVPDSRSLNPGSKTFSYTARVQTDRIPPAGGDYDLLRHGAASTKGGGFRLEILNSKGVAKAYCSISDSNGHTASLRGTTNLADGKLHTLTCSKTSSRIALKVDSLALITKSVSLGSINNAKPFVVGVKSPTTTSSDGDWFYGTMRSASMSVGQ